MKKAFSTIFLLGILGLIAWGVWLLFPSDEKVIRKQLTRLAESVSTRPDDSNLARLAANERLRDIFAPDVIVNIEVRGYRSEVLHGRADVLSTLATAKTVARNLQVQLTDPEIQFNADRTQARAATTAIVDYQGQRHWAVQELQFTFIKSDGDWMIQQIETIYAVAK